MSAVICSEKSPRPDGSGWMFFFVDQSQMFMVIFLDLDIAEQHD